MLNARQEIKIEVEPEITHQTVQDVLEDYKIKEEDDMNSEFTSEIVLPTEEKIVDDFQGVKEEVPQEENLNIEHEEAFDDPMVENQEGDQDAMYSKTSDIPSSRPKRRCTISQMEKNKSKDDDHETCDNSPYESNEDDADEDQEESYSEKTTHICNVSSHFHPKVNSGPQLHACPVCREAFNNSTNLEVHKLIHISEKPHICSVCSKAFKMKTNLTTHMRTHTGEKNYKCEVCSKAFNRVDSLRRHMRLHTGEKPYTCDVCSKAFTDSGTLKSHMRLHTGERPYTCEVCSNSFTQVTHLKDHMRVHTGEKPYTCDVCSFPEESYEASHWEEALDI